MSPIIVEKKLLLFVSPAGLLLEWRYRAIFSFLLFTSPSQPMLPPYLLNLSWSYNSLDYPNTDILMFKLLIICTFHE